MNAQRCIFAGNPPKIQRLCRNSNKRGHTLQWRHDELDGISNHQCLDCLLNRSFRCRSKKASKLRVTGLCEGTSPVAAQRASSAENVFIWWRHHGFLLALEWHHHVIIFTHSVLYTLNIVVWNLNDNIGKKRCSTGNLNGRVRRTYFTVFQFQYKHKFTELICKMYEIRE